MEQPRLVIVEDNPTLAATLQKSFERRGYRVWHADSAARLATVLETAAPRFAVVDLKLGAESGLVCVQRLHAYDPEMRIVVLTGFASLATAVEAIKLGACQYLAKPSNTDDIEAAFASAPT
ncbi:MAG: response regulator, partial [Brevundimonas sp.]